MPRKKNTLSIVPFQAIALLLIAPAVRAADDSSSVSAQHSDQAILLTPFEVQEGTDHGYSALNSNSITGFNTQLDKLPISADIFDQKFMQDVGATTVEDLLSNYSAGSGVTASDPGSLDTSGANQPGGRGGNVATQLRGLSTPTMQRDGFMNVGNAGSTGGLGVGVTSNFDLERVEVINGPQSLLYGGGGGGGVINIVSKAARLGAPSFGSLQYAVDDYGSKTAVFDVGAGSSTVAARFSILNGSFAYRTQNSGGPAQGYYGQIAIRPFSNTVIRLTAETSTYDRIRPNSATYTGPSTDPRSGLSINYLAAANLLGATNPATGAAYADGAVDNGYLNAGNAQSYNGQWALELTNNDFETMTVETQWSPHLSTFLGLGYANIDTNGIDPSLAIYAPNVTSNPLGNVWAASLQPAGSIGQLRRKAIRASALLTNDLFGGRVHSTTAFGADFNRTDSWSVNNYTWWQADSNFNIIYNPALTPATANGWNGRTQIPKLYWSINQGPVRYNLFNPLAKQVTVNGVNYVQALYTTPINPALISAADPLGVPLGSGDVYLAKFFNKGIYGANYSEWFDNRLTSIVGFRLADTFEQNISAGNVLSALQPMTNTIAQISGAYLSFNAGLDYRLLPWLRAYASVSDSFNPPYNPTFDPGGAISQIAHAIGQEVGLKVSNGAGTLSGQLAVYHVNSYNEQYGISSSLSTDINPSGINGKFGFTGNTINLNRTAEGAQVTVTAAPTPNWRLRLSAALTQGQILTTKYYGQLYNDQFHANAQGAVTYADGTAVYVPATPSASAPTTAATTPGAIPLTIAVLTNPSSPYFVYTNNAAGLNNVSGQINNTAALDALRVVDPIHGAIATGLTGLPISESQISAAYAYLTNGPQGQILASRAGQDTVGYPEYSLNLTNVYTFSSGWEKGIEIGGTAAVSILNRQYYYYTSGVGPTSPEAMFYFPNRAQFNLILGYTRKLRRVTFSTQINVNNLLNHYDVIILPNEATAYATPTATYWGQPRQWIWSSTLAF